MFLPVDPAGDVFVVDRAVVDVDGLLVQSQGEVDAEPYGEGVGIVDPGRRRVVVLGTKVAPQPTKLAVSAVVGGAVDPGLTGRDERQAGGTHGSAHAGTGPPSGVLGEGTVMTVPDAGLEIFLIAVVGGSGKLELLRPTGRVGRFREDDHVADSGRRLRPVVETVYADRVEGLGVDVVDPDHVRHLGRRQGVGVAGPQDGIDGRDLSIDGPDCLGVVMGHDQATVAVEGSGWAVWIHYSATILTAWSGKPK